MAARSRHTVALALGSAANGLLAYVVFALTTRILGHDAAPVSVLWSYWGFAGAALTFPLQHWIARTLTADGPGTVRHSLPRVTGLIAGVAVTSGVLAWLGRDALFHRDDVWFPLLVTLVTVGSALMGVVRGSLGGRDRFGAVAVSLATENAVRCVAVGIVAGVGDDDPVAYGFCIVAGYLAAGCWPSALHFGPERTTARAHSAMEFLSGAGLAQLLGQVVLTGGPVALALAGGSAAQVTALFAALALFRAPYTLALGMVAQLTTAITRLVVSGAVGGLRRIRAVTVAATVVLCALGGLGAAWLGPDVIRLIFGDTIDFPVGESAIVAIGCVLAVANLIQTIISLAHDRPGTVAVSWVVALLGGVVAYVVLADLAASEAIVWCFLVAESVAFASLLLADYRRGVRQ